MRLFHKHLKPEDLGAMLYEVLRTAMESDGDLSLEQFIGNLELTGQEPDEHYAGEVMTGLMFSALLAIERSAPDEVARRIFHGMRREFHVHLQEQGAAPYQKAEWDDIIDNRIEIYRACLKDYSGFEPPWKLGRQFFWNIISEERYTVMSIKIATLYLMAARDVAQNLLNEYGPNLLFTPNA